MPFVMRGPIPFERAAHGADARSGLTERRVMSISIHSQMSIHPSRNSVLRAVLASVAAAAVVAGAAPVADRARAASVPALGGVIVEPDGDGIRVHVVLPAPVRYATSASGNRVVITLDGVAATPASHRINVGLVTGVGVRALGGHVLIDVTTRAAMTVTAASFDGPNLVVRLAPRAAAHVPAPPVRVAPAASVPGPPAGGNAAPPDVALALTLEEGAGRLLDVAGLVRVAVADPQVLGVVPVSAEQLLVTARSQGRTTMYVWDRTGRIWTYAVEVAPASGLVDALRRLISTTVPTAAVTVTAVPGGGPEGATLTAPSAAPAPPALDSNAPALSSPIAAPSRDAARSPAEAPGPGAVPARGPEGSGGIVLSGSVETQADREKIEAIARAFAPTVVNLLTVRRPVQFQLQVEVVEIDRNALRNLGVTWGGGEQTPGFPPSLNGGVYNLQIITTPGLGTAGLDLLIAQLQALAQQGRAKLLAEPNLVVMAGTSASLLLGGQVPIPVAGDNGAVTVEYKDFGVILNARPDAQEDGRLFMRIAPEVSTLDYDNAIKVNGFTIPALRVRRVETVVSMRPSDTLVLGGLLQHQDAELIQKIPVLGDLPVIGPLFRSTQFQHQETELVIFVTPVTVAATDAPAAHP